MERARRRRQLKHPLGGKTGTTNDYTDAWFIGFSPSVTCGTWIGFDNRESLGEKETGAKAALPMWMDFMKAAIADKPNEAFPTRGCAEEAAGCAGERRRMSDAEAAEGRSRMSRIRMRRTSRRTTPERCSGAEAAPPSAPAERAAPADCAE